MDHTVAKTPERDAFYRRIDGENLSALWNVLGDLITREPKSPCRPHLWRYEAIRRHMMEAGKLITAKEAACMGSSKSIINRCARIQVLATFGSSPGGPARPMMLFRLLNAISIRRHAGRMLSA